MYLSVLTPVCKRQDSLQNSTSIFKKQFPNDFQNMGLIPERKKKIVTVPGDSKNTSGKTHSGLEGTSQLPSTFAASLTRGGKCCANCRDGDSGGGSSKSQPAPWTARVGTSATVPGPQHAPV